MQDRVQATLNGQEFLISDWNTVAAEASRADDLVLAELLRMAPYDGTTVTRGVRPFGDRAMNANVGVVAGLGSGFKVMPFRAVIGSRTVGDNLDIRSAVYTSAAALIPPSGGGTARVHLVYAAIHVDVITATTALVKDTTSSVVAALPVNSNAHTYVTVGLVSATAPTLPALPADTTGVYNIPLAYVRTASGYAGGGIATVDVLDVAPILNDFRHNTGVPNKLLYVTKPADDVATWAGGGSRPTLYQPAGGIGSVQRVIPIAGFTSFGAADLAADFLVDDSVDWRNRIFKSNYQLASNSHDTDYFAWTGSSNSMPKYGVLTHQCMGNSINVNATTTRRTVFRTDSSTDSAVWTGSLSAGYFELYVDPATGNLRGAHGIPSGTSLSATVLIWLEATAPFSDV